MHAVPGSHWHDPCSSGRLRSEGRAGRLRASQGTAREPTVSCQGVPGSQAPAHPYLTALVITSRKFVPDGERRGRTTGSSLRPAALWRPWQFTPPEWHGWCIATPWGRSLGKPLRPWGRSRSRRQLPGGRVAAPAHLHLNGAISGQSADIGFSFGVVWAGRRSVAAWP